MIWTSKSYPGLCLDWDCWDCHPKLWPYNPSHRDCCKKSVGTVSGEELKQKKTPQSSRPITPSHTGIVKGSTGTVKATRDSRQSYHNPRPTSITVSFSQVRRSSRVSSPPRASLCEYSVKTDIILIVPARPGLFQEGYYIRVVHMEG